MLSDGSCDTESQGGAGDTCAVQSLRGSRAWSPGLWGAGTAGAALDMAGPYLQVFWGAGAAQAALATPGPYLQLFWGAGTTGAVLPRTGVRTSAQRQGRV